jgi:hypothetical protein
MASRISGAERPQSGLRAAVVELEGGSKEQAAMGAGHPVRVPGRRRARYALPALQICFTRYAGSNDSTTSSAHRGRRSPLPAFTAAHPATHLLRLADAVAALWAVCGRRRLRHELFLGQPHPSPRNLNQVSAILLVDMLRHVEALRRTIKVEVAFRFHNPPFQHCGLPQGTGGIPTKSGIRLQRFNQEVHGPATTRTVWP